MEGSEEQFNELLTQLLVRASKMQNEINEFIPFGILITARKEIEIVLALDVNEGLSKTLSVIHEQLKSKVAEGEWVASCITYADCEKSVLVVNLENNENYCLKTLIPFKSGSEIALMPEEIEEYDGSVNVFPVIEAS